MIFSGHFPTMNIMGKTIEFTGDSCFSVEGVGLTMKGCRQNAMKKTGNLSHQCQIISEFLKRTFFFKSVPNLVTSTDKVKFRRQVIELNQGATEILFARLFFALIVIYKLL